MNSKIFGGILLVVGTTIGAGMLALPMATAQLGFVESLVLLIVSWCVMVACAFLFLEVNLWLPPNSNLISMAGATLGRGGQAIAWLFYLTMLYSVISAYIAGGGDLFHYLLASHGVQLPVHVATILFTALLGSVVYLGIKSVDYVNRGLMFGKLGALILLVIFLFPYVSSDHLMSGDFVAHIPASSISITVVAFACLMIIPSLRTYFDHDVKTLRKVIFIGMLIPLLCYIAWDLVIMGVIPYEGTPGLKQIAQSGSNSELVAALAVLLNKNVINMLAKFFTSICMATSFLSISLSLSDFLSDGLKVKKEGMGAFLVFGATFLPPIAIVIFYPNAFLLGLNFAGVSCFILMVLMPPIMAWRGRYHHEIAQGYQVSGGKFLLALLVVFATLMIGLGCESAI